MRSMYRVALAVCALAVAVCAVGASSALAAESPEWYSSTTKPAPEWQQGGVKISEAAATKWTGKVALADVQLETKVECAVSSGEGSAGPGAVGKETSWTLSSCKRSAKAENAKGEEVTNKCGTFEKAEIKDLPWHTELAISAGNVRDAITAEGKGSPSFSVKCTGVTNTCTLEEAEQLSTSVANVTGGVDLTFGGGPVFKCSLGGKEAGKIESTELIEAVKGAKLEANTVEGTFSKLTSSHEVKATGKLTVEDKSFKLGATCEVEAKGTIEAAGKGKITSYTTAGCKPIGCGALESEDPVGLPWSTELFAEEGTKDGILSGSWQFRCSGSTDTCNLPSAGTLNVVEGNVVLLFSEKRKTHCSLGGNEQGAWQGELTLAPTAGGAIKVEG
jgi:hypothetical protein